MIVRAGGLTLTAPDEVPAEARAPLEELHEHARMGLGAPPGSLTLLEDVVFGPEGARQLRRRGTDARAAVYGQLIRGWGEHRLRLSPFARPI